jgi:hypothetical protein
MGSFLRVASEPNPKREERQYIPPFPPISGAARQALRHVSAPPSEPKGSIVTAKEDVRPEHVPAICLIRTPQTLNHKGGAGTVKDIIKSFESISQTEGPGKVPSRRKSSVLSQSTLQ